MEATTGPASGSTVDRETHALDRVRRAVTGERGRRLLGGVAGLVTGTALGFYLTLAIFVAEARAGQYIFSLHDLAEFRWQMIPTALGMLGGAVLGWRRSRLLLRIVLGAVGGSAVLALVGWFAGPFLWEGDSASWAGATLAAALGLLAGAAVPAVRHIRKAG